MAEPTAKQPPTGGDSRKQRHSPATTTSTAHVSSTAETPRASTGSSNASKKRGREGNSPVPTSGILMQSAIVQASQVCTKLGYHGLAGLLMNRSTSVAATLAAASSAASTAVTGSSQQASLYASGALPSIQEVQQAATKAHQDQPPWIHWSKNDMSQASMRVTSSHRLELQGNLPSARNCNSGYRMARANVGVSSGSYFFETWILDPPPTTKEILQALPTTVRLSPKLRQSLQKALEYEETQQNPPPPPQPQSLQKQPPQTFSASKSDEDASEDGGEGSPNKRAKTEESQTSISQEEEPDEPPRRVGGHVRLGWSMRTGDIHAPVGYDRWSFGIRDIGGSIITDSQRIDNWIGSEGFGPGDVIGCSISLYNDDEDEDRNNHIRFFKNGLCMGEFVIAKGKRSGGEAPFPCDIPQGTYYPAVSCYMGGSLRVNFGPKFVYPPKKLPAGLKLLPLSELSPAPEINPQTVMAQMASVTKLLRSGGSKHVDYVQQMLQQSVQTEARILKNLHENFVRQNLLEIRQERLDRGLAVQDLDSLLEEQP